MSVNGGKNEQAPSNPAALAKTEAQLKRVIETFIELGVMVHDFQGTVEAKEGLVERVNMTTQQFRSLVETSADLTEAIPIDVIQYIEDGRNPDVYTREFVEVLAKQNHYLNGKMEATRQFRDILAEQIKIAYPDLELAVNNSLKRTDDKSTTE
ncbi:subunit of the RNA polymerase II mediator complex [Nadsonia fulvescens var. elongata DSM 6958]|uniref:Mediator of RNA polymerase II transcription subunit 10 n=1 Tax=Nadsonia fulvescens var. elongata DSM 6958 TaxID=857566 RepID=A0A1E3PTF7_9ASCO|nr:subunit of the RNA polymerase II mediator complex [Nadsonia fulvescens var. elongata DSM 6958]